MNNEIRVSTWEECEQKIKEIEETSSDKHVGVWFRGHSSSDWRLTTTLERRAPRRQYSIIEYYSLIRRIRPEIEAFTQTEWEIPSFQETEEWAKTYEAFSIERLQAYGYLAHLRHHGFPSPLLDWTRSPYVAAYFAFARPDADEVALFVYSERPSGFKIGDSDRPAIIAFGPIVRTHKRHFTQQSGYTMCAMFDAKRGWIFTPHQAVFDLGRETQDLLWKIVIPSTERKKVLHLLDRFNLNQFTLFGSEESLMETLAVRHIDLEHIPIGSNRGDSPGFVNERV